MNEHKDRLTSRQSNSDSSANTNTNRLTGKQTKNKMHDWIARCVVVLRGCMAQNGLILTFFGIAHIYVQLHVITLATTVRTADLAS